MTSTSKGPSWPEVVAPGTPLAPGVASASDTPALPPPPGASWQQSTGLAPAPARHQLPGKPQAPPAPALGTVLAPPPGPPWPQSTGLAPGTVLAPPPGPPWQQSTSLAPGTVLAPPPGPSWQQSTGLAPGTVPAPPTGSWEQPSGTPQALGAAPAPGTVPTPFPTWPQPVAQGPTTQVAPAAGTGPTVQGSSRSRKRIARIAERASSLIPSMGRQPLGTVPVPKPRANTLPADNRRNASASRDKTPDADFTIDELQQDQVFSVPTSSIDGMGRVVAYQKIGFGRSVIVATGPNRFCKYRIRPARDYGIGYKTDIPLVTPRPDAHGKGFALAGIAYADKSDNGPACLNPGTRLMPRTYIKVKWDDGTPDTWETRTILRKLMGKAVADQAIFDSAARFEWDARLFMENHPGWDQGDLVTVKRESDEEPGEEPGEDSDDESMVL